MFLFYDKVIFMINYIYDKVIFININEKYGFLFLCIFIMLFVFEVNFKNCFVD